MSDLDDLYREILLDHYRSPRNRGPLDGANARAEGSNPLCGDELALELRLDGEGRIDGVAFTGSGCSISQASSSLMTEYVKGRTAGEAIAGAESFRALMTGDGAAAAGLGDIEALAGVRKFPVRVKCAALAWKTLELALERRGADDGDALSPVTTDKRSTPDG